MQKALETEAEKKAAAAGAAAAEPYHAMMAKGQKLVTEYQKKALELATASEKVFIGTRRKR
jgi:hypothetical protein